MTNSDERLKYLMCANVIKLTLEFINISYCKRGKFIYR